MAEHQINLTISNEGTRNDIRLNVVNALSNEVPGTSTETERYTYYVETLSDGNRVYLRRPANLHFGFDFLVCVENSNYALPNQRRRNYPKHTDIANDLQAKKEENGEMYKKLFALIKKVYECHDIQESELIGIHFSFGLPVDHILKVLKWLFIEQDIRYWNYSGRAMTWGLVPCI